MNDILNHQKVEKIFLYCMFNDDEARTTYLPVPGITTNVEFHPVRIAEKRDEIVAMLGELPQNFMEESGRGRGWSFLQAHKDQHGHQWTDEHRVMEHLFQLGIAAGVASYIMSREMWTAMPGGVPYIVVYAEPKAVEEVTITV